MPMPKQTASRREPATDVLELDAIEVAYDRVIQVLHGVSLTVRAGGVTALLGPNGAGKSTTLKAISNLLGVERGTVTKGRITFDGTTTQGLPPARLVGRGLVQVMEGRRCFEHLSTEDNLLTGAHTRCDGRAAVRRSLDEMFETFPKLKDRRDTLAGYLSGGEQQMLALGRALMAKPKLILLDEPSMGLAPQLVGEIFRIIRHLNETQGVSFLLAEQNARLALDVADQGVVLENGRVVLSGTADALKGDGAVQAFYLGYGEAAQVA